MSCTSSCAQQQALLLPLPPADLVEDCTRLDPFARPSFRDVLLRLKSLAGFAERQDMPPF